MASKSSSLFSFILLAALCLGGYLWYSGQLGPRIDVANDNLNKSSGLLKTEGEFRDKLAELKMRRNDVLRWIKRSQSLKGETIAELKEKGIASGADFKNSADQDVKKKVLSLKEAVDAIDKYKKEVSYYDNAISSIQAMLEKVERQRIDESISLSEQEYLDLQKVIVDLDERLNVDTTILEDEELGNLLDLEMVESE